MHPLDAVVRDSLGNLYGTTTNEVFELSPNGSGGWAGKILHVFPFITSDHPDGWYPESSLILDQAGNLYGTTPNGGISDGGAVFEVSK